MVDLCCKCRSHLGQLKLFGMVFFLELRQEIKIGKQLDLVKEAVHGLEGVILFHFVFTH